MGVYLAFKKKNEEDDDQKQSTNKHAVDDFVSESN